MSMRTRTTFPLTLHYKTIHSGQSKKLQGPLWRKASHTTMSGYDCRNKCVDKMTLTE